MGVLRNIRKSRRWGWYDKDITDCLRENFSGQRLTTALATYLSLTELASNSGSDEFTAYHSQIAKLAGKSVSTVRSYCNQFINLGILAKENRKVDNKTNLANKWSLLTPSVNNNYQTLSNNYHSSSVENGYQQLEENELEENNQNDAKKFSETPAYKNLRDQVSKLRGGRTWSG